LSSLLQGKKAGYTFPPADENGKPSHLPLSDNSPVEFLSPISPLERKERLSVIHYSPEIPKEAKRDGTYLVTGLF
jgi:hypothetical protein